MLSAAETMSTASRHSTAPSSRHIPTPLQCGLNSEAADSVCYHSGMKLTLIPSLLMLLFAMQKGQEPTVPPDVAAAPKDAQVTASGLASKVLLKGNGTAHPTLESEVTVHYSGWTTDGKMFDSSVQRGEPATFPLNRVIKGWQEGVQLMVV